MKIAIITGVSQGLGEALAESLLQRDFFVLGVGRRDNPKLQNPNYEFLLADLKDPMQLQDKAVSVFSKLAEKNGESVFLINNAAMMDPCGLVGQMDLQKVKDTFDVNLLSPIALCDAFCKVFHNQKFLRRIINVSSGHAKAPFAGNGPYCQSKVALEFLTGNLVLEQTGELPIEAITVRPGIIDTNMQVKARSSDEGLVPGVQMYKDFYEQGRLWSAEKTAKHFIENYIFGDVKTGETYAIQ